MKKLFLAPCTALVLGTVLVAGKAQSQNNVLALNVLTNGPSLSTTNNWILVSGPSAGLGSAPGATANVGSHDAILFNTPSNNLTFSSGNIYGVVYNVTNGLSYTIQGNGTNLAPSFRLGDTNNAANFVSGWDGTSWINPISGGTNELVFLTNNSSLEIDYTNLGVTNLVNPGGPVSLSIRNGGNFNISSNCALTINAPLTLVGSRTVTLNGQGLVVLGNSSGTVTNSYVNKTVITSGTLRVMSPSALSGLSPFSVSGSLTDTSTLDLGTPGTYGISSYTPGGILHVTASGGSGTLNITNASALSGTADKALSAGTNVTINILNSLDLAGTSPNSRNFLLQCATNSTIQLAGGVTGTSGVLQFGISKSGEGSAVLSGTSSYSGGTIISAGKLQVAGPASLPSTTTITTGSSQSDSTLLDLASAGSYSAYSMTLSGILRVTASGGSGTLTFANASALTGNANKTMDSGTNVNVVLSGSLDLAGTSTTSRNLNLQGAGNFTFNNSLTGTSASLQFGLNNAGPGTATLNSANTYNGDTQIDGGVLALGASGSIASSTNIIVARGATFDVSALGVGGFTLGSSQILSNRTSTGIINGNVNATAATLSLVFTNNGSACILVTNGTLSLASTTVVKVSNASTSLTGGSYKLISRATNGATGLVTASTLPTVTVGGNGASGAASLSVVGGELYLNIASATAPKLNIGQVDNVLTFSWTASGYKLQAQTNTLGVGVANNWFDYPGGSVSGVTATINNANPAVFFRLAPQ